jgi:hypothetical protein
MDSATIRKRIETCRKELERQEMMEKRSIPKPWTMGTSSLSGRPIICKDDGRVLGVYDRGLPNAIGSKSDGELVCLSRNLNPARLAVAREFLIEVQARYDGKHGWFDKVEPLLIFAERLLGLKEG